MSHDDEPDLLDWRPPQGGATVIAFPLAKCVGKARIVASVILRCKTPGTQQAAFDRAASAIGRKLRAAGVEERSVAAQIDNFAKLVNTELRRHDARRQA